MTLIRALQESKTITRKAWENKYHVQAKDKGAYMILRNTAGTFMTSYKPTPEDIFATDWQIKDLPYCGLKISNQEETE